jgi:hypothetical protein
MMRSGIGWAVLARALQWTPAQPVRLTSRRHGHFFAPCSPCPEATHQMAVIVLTALDMKLYMLRRWLQLPVGVARLVDDGPLLRLHALESAPPIMNAFSHAPPGTRTLLRFLWARDDVAVTCACGSTQFWCCGHWSDKTRMKYS